ncbi:FAD-dependent oxidoreductase, partial [Acinetobacter baumannii]
WNRSGGHINPLALSRGMARAAIDRGARIFARSPATHFERKHGRWIVTTPQG